MQSLVGHAPSHPLSWRIEEFPTTGTLPLPSAASNQNFDWIVRNFANLSLQHPNCWIAVDQSQVLAADPDLGEVHKAAAGKAQPGDAVYFFVDDGSLIF